MSNPTELPDLDRLEALARAATPGIWEAQRHGVIVAGPMRQYVNGSARSQIANFTNTFHEDDPEDEPCRKDANAAFCAAANPAAVLALIALARRPPVPAQRPTDDELWDSTIRDRDTYREWADKLADAIAIHFGVDIGEHSNQNCPWHEALEAIENAEPARRAQPEGEAPQAVLVTPQEAAAAGIECGDTACGGCNAGEPWCIHAPAAQHAESGALEAADERVDAIVTGLYHRFKGWSKRGFGADDVTWCEVKADVIALIAAQSQGAQAKRLTEAECEDIAVTHAMSGSRRGSYYQFDKEGLDAFALDIMGRTSAPGTPEAPANPHPYAMSRDCFVSDRGYQVYLSQLEARSAPQTAAARDVLAERQRQVEAEGWTPEHDDHHDNGQMAVAAGYYALASGYPHERDIGHASIVPTYWPWAPAWWKPSKARRNLIKAGALILAEIERLDRAAQLDGGQGEKP